MNKLSIFKVIFPIWMKDINMISLSIRGTNFELPTVAKTYKFRRIERNSAEIKLVFLHMICTQGTMPTLT